MKVVFLLHKLFFEVSTTFRFVDAYVLRWLTKGSLVDPWVLHVSGNRKYLGVCCCVCPVEFGRSTSGQDCDLLAGVELFWTSHALLFGSSLKCTESNDFVGGNSLIWAKVLTIQLYGQEGTIAVVLWNPWGIGSKTPCCCCSCLVSQLWTAACQSSLSLTISQFAQVHVQLSVTSCGCQNPSMLKCFMEQSVVLVVSTRFILTSGQKFDRDIQVLFRFTFYFRS